MGIFFMFKHKIFIMLAFKNKAGYNQYIQFKE